MNQQCGKAVPADLLEIASTLENSAGADIFYDANDFGDVPSAKRIEKTRESMQEAAKVIKSLVGINLISHLEISRQVLECPAMTKLVAESMDVSGEEMSRLREGLNSFMEGETAEQPPTPLTPMQKNVLVHYCGGEFAHLGSVRESEAAGDGLLTFLLREIGDVAGNSSDGDAVDEIARALYVVGHQVIEVARNLQT